MWLFECQRRVMSKAQSVTPVTAAGKGMNSLSRRERAGVRENLKVYGKGQGHVATCPYFVTLL